METHRPIERQAFSAREGCFRTVFFTGWLFSTREGCFPDRFPLFSAREGCFPHRFPLPATERLLGVFGH